MRTTDTMYGKGYWDTYDSGAGYRDGPLWEDLAHIVKEMWAYDSDDDDRAGELNILDVGCAMGFLVKHLRLRGFDAWGADISNYAIQASESKYRPFLRNWSVTDDMPPQWDWASFERVICLETLEHVFYPEKALANVHDLVKEGGEALLAICVEENPGWDTDPTHVSIYPRAWWEERMEELEFERLPEKEDYLQQFHFWRGHNGIFVVKSHGSHRDPILITS